MTKYPNNIDQINSTKINYAAIDRPPTIKWYKLGVKLRKLERSIAPGEIYFVHFHKKYNNWIFLIPGLFLCLAACVLRQTCYLYYSEYVASHDSIRPFDGIVGFMFDFIWEIGVCFGALCSGFKQRTWSIRWTNVIQFIERFFFIFQIQKYFFFIFRQLSVSCYWCQLAWISN